MSLVQNSPFRPLDRQLTLANRELQTADKLLKAAEHLDHAASQFAQAATAAAPPQNACNCLPAPAPEQSCAPAGSALTKGGAFGENAVTTAGGYTVVPNGNTSWDIFEPGQKPGDKPASNISGDPHVLESDGTKWDFTKNSNFRLPDGTNIAVGTSAQTGYAVSKSLDITNGPDRVQISGVDGKPTVGDVTHDGFQARADLAHQDTYTLGGDPKNVKWFKADAEGKQQGEVVGAEMTTKDGVQQYVQKTDDKSQYLVDPSLQPKLGTPAWGNALRDAFVDSSNKIFGAGSGVTNAVAQGSQASNDQDVAQQKMRQQLQTAIQSLVQLFSMLNLSSTNRASTSF